MLRNMTQHARYFFTLQKEGLQKKKNMKLFKQTFLQRGKKNTLIKIEKSIP
jgi:hypothetical protein